MTTRGRKRKYDKCDPDFKELVYLYRKENPTGKVTFRGMATFSKQLHEDNQHHVCFNEDVWKTYGRRYIEDANKVIQSKIITKNKGTITIPNVSEVIKKFSVNQEKTISLLQPMERQLHDAILKNEMYEDDIQELKEKLRKKNDLIKRYEEFIGQMAHHSYMKSFQDEYGLINQIDMGVNRSERVQEAIGNTDDVGSFMKVKNRNLNKEENISSTSKEKLPSNVTGIWMNLKEKNKI